MTMRFTLGRGSSRTTFVRAEQHTAKWDEQKKGFRMMLGMPAHGTGK